MLKKKITTERSLPFRWQNHYTILGGCQIESKKSDGVISPNNGDTLSM